MANRTALWLVLCVLGGLAVLKLVVPIVRVWVRV